MAGILVREISAEQAQRLVADQEGHFLDFKAIEVAPGKLTRTMVAFANAEGGELYVGFDETPNSDFVWRGFNTPEDANGHIQAFDQIFPLGDALDITFLRCNEYAGLIVKAEVKKTKDIKRATDGVAYVRRGASSTPVTSPESLEILQRNKGLISFESETVNVPLDLITNSEQIISFLIEVIPSAEPQDWLRKQQLMRDHLPTVAGLVLFGDEPQAAIPKRCGIKVYRYSTSEQLGTRETLAFDPISIEGSAYSQIENAVAKTREIIQGVRIHTATGLEEIIYPEEALHEVITNAVIHRDYSITDDIHITVFDNRVEVKSPGTLPAHITVDNILDERFARNPAIVRLINKFPNPPNKDVGEGLNTAFEAMRGMRLKPPTIEQLDGYVKISLRHESLATPEELILEYLAGHDEIANKLAREICHIGSENQVKRIFQKMIQSQLIELIPGRTRYTAAYRKAEHKALDVVENPTVDLFGDAPKH